MENIDLLSVVLPQFFPAHWLKNAPDMIFTDFPSRIRIGYVVREEGAYSYVMHPALEEADISVSALHASALRNLRALPLPGLTVGKTPGGPEAFLEDVDDNFRAIRILLPVVEEVLAHQLGDEYFLAIPCRDWFFCWSKNQSPEWQQRNISHARKNFLEDDYNLTPDILLRSKAGFSLHLTQNIDA
jgi:uncharacterized protein YtpQ (UPF0354 family)